eukprot:SAG11_NODE_37479_length_256_cov_2.171975_1_plen_23_part_10
MEHEIRPRYEYYRYERRFLTTCQ